MGLFPFIMIIKYDDYSHYSHDSLYSYILLIWDEPRQTVPASGFSPGDTMKQAPAATAWALPSARFTYMLHDFYV